LNPVKVFYYMLLTIALVIPSGIQAATAYSPDGTVNLATNFDTLQTLGLLVEKNKVSNNALSVKYAKMALEIAQQGDSVKDLVDAYKWIGKAYYQNQKDSSYYYFNLALQKADSNNLVRQKLHIYYNLASLYQAAYNYDQAMKLLNSSIRLADSIKDVEGISNAYIALGSMQYITHDYDNARKNYTLALNVATRDTMYKQIGVAMGNLARQAFNENDTVKMIAMEKEALSNLRKITGVEEEMATIYMNLGYLYLVPDSALFYYRLALKLAVNANLYKIQFAIYNNMAYSYLDKGDVQKAEACLRDQAIPLAMEKKDNDWLASLYDTYADVCVKKGEYKQAFEFKNKSIRARKIDTQQKAAEQVRLLAALLDVKNKELKIQREEKELLEQSNRVKQVELWLVIALLLVAASIFITFLLQQRNRAKFQREQIGSAKRIIEMEETEKGRIARELHDLTGQLVLGISGTIENIDFPDHEIKDQIKARIIELGASIRQISHRMNRAMIEHFTFNEMITGLCEDMQKLSRMRIEIEISDEFPDLPNDLVLHFYRITQELLTNAGKYARDSQVKIRVYNNNGNLTLSYFDNGPGFAMGEKSKPSMGILNIFERAKLVGGQAKVDSAPGKGTSWEIFFPIGKKT
jgi:two-component system, NarL family, sensor kinase